MAPGRMRKRAFPTPFPWPIAIALSSLQSREEEEEGEGEPWAVDQPARSPPAPSEPESITGHNVKACSGTQLVSRLLTQPAPLLALPARSAVQPWAPQHAVKPLSPFERCRSASNTRSMGKKNSEQKRTAARAAFGPMQALTPPFCIARREEGRRQAGRRVLRVASSQRARQWVDDCAREHDDGRGPCASPTLRRH